MKKFIPFVLFCGFVLSAMFMSCEQTANQKEETVPTPTPAEKMLTSIYISKQPDKTNYEYNSLLDLTGLVVKGNYSDNSLEVLEGWTSEPKAGSRLSTSGTVTVTISYEGKTTSFAITVAAKPVITSNEYFWGTWVRMDNGKEYEVLETSVVQGTNNYKVTASDSTTLTVSSLGTFTKESDGVIVCNNIPYYRKGGTNLEYSLKLVGFTTNGRAAGTAMSGIKGKGKSSKYTNFESEGESDSNGEIKLKAPTANDTQTVEITNGNDIVVIPGLKINNSGDYMGTVALVGKDDYNLKITGTISDDQKDNGYLFGNNAKTYNMLLTITNISENYCSTSVCFVVSDDPNLRVESKDGTDLDGFPISTLAGGATKPVNLSIVYGDLSKPYVDTGITVTIQNPFTGQEWKDYIPLRFFKGTIPITIAAKNPENNSNAALNGFVIYPDGNNQFFAIKNNDAKPIFVPTFGATKPYMLVFSGATVTSQLYESTEMFYTVEPASVNARHIITSGSEILKYIPFGRDNHSEDSAFCVAEGFEAYLREGEIDYYKITADSDTYYGPGGSVFYTVSYMNEKGDAPDTFLTTEGAVLKANQLQDMTCDGYKFLGWYSDATKAIPDEYAVYDNITLTAKWQLESYPVVYEMNGGTNHAANPSAYTIESSVITLEAPVRTGYDFDGWFVTENFSDSAIETIGGGAKGEITLYAKWTPVTYKISYELDGGTNASANPATYTIETDSITLAKPQKDGFTFSGWYADSSFSGTKQTTIEKGSHVDKKYYAKWLKNCTVSYITAHSTAPTAIIVGEGEKLTAEQLPELTSSDYFFGGWYSGETCVTAGSYTVTDDVTLTAKWSDKCTVSYVTDHGTAPQVFVVESGTVLTVDNLPKLKETGWKFLGWYTNSSYDEDKIASAGQSVTANITLYAKWKEFTGPDDDFVFVEGGTFSMGSTSGDSDEKPVHNVTLSSFYICDHELTQGEYVTVIGTNPSNFKSSPASEEVQENRPVEYVSWFDTIYFCNKYSESVGLTPCYKVNGNANVTSWSYTPHNGNSISGTITCDMTANGYRLPTEAEWEYAAKGGNQSNGYTYSGSNNIDSVAWYTSNSNSKTHEVKKKSANELGLFDMNGNVWEWCWDCYTSSYSNESVTDPCGNSSGSIRVLRGGSWGGLATGCRSAVRLNNDPYYRNSSYGFRLVRTDTSSCYMISYQTAHGTEPEQTLVRKSITNTELPMLTESGWKFLGWYTSSNFDEVTKANAGQSITTNLTLYAKWEEFTGPDDGFVFVEGGTVVGSDDYNQNRNSETCYIGAFPAGRTVTLSSFYMSNHELTQGEYETYCCYTEDTPRSRYGVGVDYPAYYVSWYDAIVYCNLKSIAEGLTPCYSLSGETDPKKWAGIKSSNGKYSCSYTSSNSTWNSITCNMTANGYRLPTEAEWEYAARGGYETYGTSAFANYFAGATTTNYNASENSDLNSVAWYYYNSSSKTHEVMKKTPNALGLYDMSGNVSEWCWDWYSDSVGTGSVTDPCGASTGSYRLGRGGSWGDYTYYCSVSSRTYINPYCRHYGISFRLVRSATNGSTNTESGNSYANQTQTYSFTSTVTVLPSGTDGTTGTGAKYILFGDWPQTIKADNVTVDENINEVHGSFTYYGGSDGYWYVKCKENAYESGYKYSNGTPVAQISVNSTKYFKVEPIKWRVLTENYKRTGKALLLAEKF